MISCARATRGLGRPSLDARSGRSIRPHPRRENERAWKNHSSDKTTDASSRSSRIMYDYKTGPVPCGNDKLLIARKL